MLRASRAMLILIPALLAGYAACGGVEDASEEDNGAVSAELRADPKIIGTFRDERAVAGIAVLTLKTDWTFHLEEAVQCIRWPCPRPEMNGVYKYGQLDGYNVLMLFEGARQTTMGGTYLRYLFRDDVLYVAPAVKYTAWQALPRSDDAWCRVQKDCAMQDLEGGPCAGFWSCGANVCEYTCRPVSCGGDNICPTLTPVWSEPEVAMRTEPEAPVWTEPQAAMRTEPWKEPTIIGTFRDEQAVAGIAALTLKTDWTFHIEEAVQCIKAPCVPPGTSGFYKYVQADGVDYLALYGARTLPTYLRYILKGDVLWIAPVARYSTWQALTRSDDAWCGVPNDCTLQELTPLTCLGQWVCASNVCDYACGPVACEYGTC